MHDDLLDSAAFEQNNVLFNWAEFADRLVIAKFCAIARAAWAIIISSLLIEI